MLGNLGLARESHEEVDVSVAIEIAPRRSAGIVEIRHPELRGDVDERAVVIAVQAVRHPLSEADEEIEIAIAIEVRPAIRLTSCGGEEIGLHELELWLGSGRSRLARGPWPVASAA